MLNMKVEFKQNLNRPNNSKSTWGGQTERVRGDYRGPRSKSGEGGAKSPILPTANLGEVPTFTANGID